MSAFVVGFESKEIDALEALGFRVSSRGYGYWELHHIYRLDALTGIASRVQEYGNDLYVTDATGESQFCTPYLACLGFVGRMAKEWVGQA